MRLGMEEQVAVYFALLDIDVASIVRLIGIEAEVFWEYGFDMAVSKTLVAALKVTVGKLVVNVVAADDKGQPIVGVLFFNQGNLVAGRHDRGQANARGMVQVAILFLAAHLS